MLQTNRQHTNSPVSVKLLLASTRPWYKANQQPVAVSTTLKQQEQQGRQASAAQHVLDRALTATAENSSKESLASLLEASSQEGICDTKHGTHSVRIGWGVATKQKAAVTPDMSAPL